ncbi:putative flavonol-3-O-glucoside L-rhamnosyltransferase [Arabidopsis thaliana]
MTKFSEPIRDSHVAVLAFFPRWRSCRSSLSRHSPSRRRFSLHHLFFLQHRKIKRVVVLL